MYTTHCLWPIKLSVSLYIIKDINIDVDTHILLVLREYIFIHESQMTENQSVNMPQERDMFLKLS